MTQTQHPSYPALVRDHHAAVYRAALRIVRQPADAEDVAQQVFLEILRKRERPDAASGPATRELLCWLAIRLALNHQRSARRRRAHEEPGAMERDEPISRDESAHEQHELQRVLQRELDSLPEELRVPVILRYQQGLTFAAVGDLVGCAEATAHGRVERGLARLRSTLARLGFAAVAASLTDAIAAIPPAPIPAQLETHLLGLTSAATTSALSAKLAAAAILLALTSSITWLVLDGSTAEAPAVAARSIARSDAMPVAQDPTPQDPTPTSGRQPVTPAPAPVEAPPEAAAPTPVEVTGLVTDEDGRPLSGAEIVVTSVERQGGSKSARFAVETTSDPGGRFTCALPVDGPTQGYTFVVRRQDYITWNSGIVRITRQRAPDPVVARLARSLNTAVTPYPLLVEVVDAQGRAVPKAFVRLYGPAARSGDPEYQSPDAAGVTDAAGSAKLTVATIGPKLLRVDATRQGHPIVDLRLELNDRGPHQRRIELAAGRTITGRVLGWTPGSKTHFQLQATPAEGHARIWATFDAEGGFVLRGLGSGDWTLSGGGGRWSRFTLPGVAAGTEGLQIELKSSQDPRDVGAHDGEIHGVLHDTVTGEDLVCGPFDVWLTKLPDDQQELDFDQVAERALGFRGQLAAGMDEPEPDRMFHFDGLAPGRYMVSAHERDRAFTWSGPIRLGPREVRSDVRLELRAGGTLEGVVVAADGAPLAGALVMLVGRGERGRIKVAEVDQELRNTQGRQRIGYHHTTETDAQGRFRLEHVPPGLDLVPAVLHHEFAPNTASAVIARDGETLSGLRLSSGLRR